MDSDRHLVQHNSKTKHSCPDQTRKMQCNHSHLKLKTTVLFVCFIVYESLEVWKRKGTPECFITTQFYDVKQDKIMLY